MPSNICSGECSKTRSPLCGRNASPEQYRLWAHIRHCRSVSVSIQPIAALPQAPLPMCRPPEVPKAEGMSCKEVRCCQCLCTSRGIETYTRFIEAGHHSKDEAVEIYGEVATYWVPRWSADYSVARPGPVILLIG